VRKAAGIAFLLYCGFALVFVAAYVIGATQFDLPLGPPLVVGCSVLVACAAVTQAARRHR
jgi:hypothetical protein